MTHTPDSKWWQRVDWTRLGWRILTTGMLLISIGGCIWQSFTTIRQHAIHVGWETPAVLPVIVDAFLIATLAIYWRKPGWFTGLASVAAALVTSAFNGLAYYYDPTNAGLGLPLPIVIGTGLTAPLFAVAIVHYQVYEARPPKPKKRESDAPAESADSGGSHPAPPLGDGVVLGPVAGGAANTEGSGNGAAGAGRPPARRRPTKTKKARTGGRGPNGPPVEVAAADIRRLGLTSDKQKQWTPSTSAPAKSNIP